MEGGTYWSFKENMIKDSQKYTPNLAFHWFSTNELIIQREVCLNIPAVDEEIDVQWLPWFAYLFF